MALEVGSNGLQREAEQFSCTDVPAGRPYRKVRSHSSDLASRAMNLSNPMLIVGLTGSLATGKSTVADMLRELGAKVLDADKMAHHLMRPGAPCFKSIVRSFGRGILGRGTIDRKKLASIVFNNGAALQKLEEIIHPRVIKKIKAELIRLEKAGRTQVVVIDAPLLMEAGLHRVADVIVVVKATQSQQIERAAKHLRITTSEAVRRIRAQMPLKEKVRLSDFVITNTTDLNQTRQRVQMVWFKLLKKTIRK